MGKRGIGAKPKGGIQAKPPRKKQWENARLPMSERFFLFAESLPISSGKLAGKKFRLRDWQKDMLRPVFDR